MNTYIDQMYADLRSQVLVRQGCPQEEIWNVWQGPIDVVLHRDERRWIEKLASSNPDVATLHITSVRKARFTRVPPHAQAGRFAVKKGGGDSVDLAASPGPGAYESQTWSFRPSSTKGSIGPRTPKDRSRTEND